MAKEVYVGDRAAWRAWLADNFDKETVIWLVFYKKETGKPALDYGESVEEALCFGWIDSIIKKLDDERYARKFTPRKLDSKWSAPNKRRAEKMVAAGLMTEHGLALIKAAKQGGAWDAPDDRPTLKFAMHPDFAAALAANPAAQQNFEALAPSYQKHYLGWIEVAKRADTRQRRIKEAIEKLERGEKLGLK